MKRGPSPVGGGGGGGPTSKARYESDDDNAPTELDVNFMREQNKQLSASLFSYRRKLERSDTELGSLRTRADSDASAAAVVMRQWAVLNKDLLELVHAAGVTDPNPPSGGGSSSAPTKKAETEAGSDENDSDENDGDDDEAPLGSLRRTISMGADSHLLVNVRPPASWQDRNILLLVKDEGKASAEGGPGTSGGGGEVAAAAMQDDDGSGGSSGGGGAADGNENETAAERAERLDWVGGDVRRACQRSHSLLAALLAAPAFKNPGSGGSGDSKGDGKKGSEGGLGPAAAAVLRNRALQAEVELLRDQLAKAQQQSELDKAVSRQAQSECHHAQRALDLFRAERSVSNNVGQQEAEGGGGQGGAAAEAATAGTTTTAEGAVDAPAAVSSSSSSSSSAASSSSTPQVPATPVSCSSSSALSEAAAAAAGGGSCSGGVGNGGTMVAMTPGTPAHVPHAPLSAVPSSSSARLATMEEEGEGSGEGDNGKGGGEGDKDDDDDEEGDGGGGSGEVSEELGNALQTASTRLRQLEKVREELKVQTDALSSCLASKAQLEFQLKAQTQTQQQHHGSSSSQHLSSSSPRSSSSGGGGQSESLLLARLSRLQQEADREREAARLEREASARLGEDLRRLNERCSAAEGRYEEWASGAGKQWREEAAMARKEAQASSATAKAAANGLARLEDAEKENVALKRQVEEYGKVVGEEQRRQTASRAEAQRAREQEALIAQDAAQARKTAEAATATAAAATAAAAAAAAAATAASPVAAADASLVAALTAAVSSLEACHQGLRGEHGDGGASAELEAQRAMNEAMIAELEQMAKAQDELAGQNARLLAVGSEQEDVNRMLMMRARQLREAKEAQEGEREALAQRLVVAEARGAAVEEASKAKDAYLRQAEGSRRERDAALLGREQALSSATERATKALGEVEELKLNAGKEASSATANAARVAELSEVAKGLRSARDALEEQLDEKQRRLDKTARRLEKEKSKRASLLTATGEGGGKGGGGGVTGGGGGGAGGGGGGGGGEDEEYRELLEFANEELKKQVNCCINKERAKDVMLVQCGHAFSREAIDQRCADRGRRCPACNKKFAMSDVKSLYLTW